MEAYGLDMSFPQHIYHLVCCVRTFVIEQKYQKSTRGWGQVVWCILVFFDTTLVSRPTAFTKNTDKMTGV